MANTAPMANEKKASQLFKKVDPGANTAEMERSKVISLTSRGMGITRMTGQD